MKSGKLGVGYGADNIKIGPEYGFGLSMAQKIKGPILLIKASWGANHSCMIFARHRRLTSRVRKPMPTPRPRPQQISIKFREVVKLSRNGEKSMPQT